MSRTIFKDMEEAIERVVRRISTHDNRTVDKVFLRETFDPITGSVIKVPIEPDFHDSSANAGNILYPHFFIRLMKTREDIYSNRAVPQYGKWCRVPVESAPGAYEVIVSESDGLITAPGNTLETGLFQIRKVQAGHLLRLLSGNNKGTYIVDSITVSALGSHTITVSDVLVSSLPAFTFNSTTRELVFLTQVDLNTVEIGDVFTDSLSAAFNITAVDISRNSITIDGVAAPDTDAAGTITRTGDIFKNSDPSLIAFLVMDPTKPIMKKTLTGEVQGTSQYVGTSPEIPIDAYYRVRIDSKEQSQHTQILNRIWEEFNPPRTAIPVIVRSQASACELLTEDITAGGSTNVKVADNANYNINDDVYVFDDLTPGRDDCGKFPEPFKSKIVDKINSDTLVLADTVPDTFTTNNCSKIVSNAEFRTFMFHFVDHATKDVEGAQYWVHEFTFWVQFWVDKAEQPEEIGVITDIETPVGTEDSGIIIDD